MLQVIVFDSGPLGIATNTPNKSQTVVNCFAWMEKLIQANCRIVVPAVADYELRRELIRLGNTSGLNRLNLFNAVLPDRYLPLYDADIKLAAQLWAQTRNAGTPTADPKALDADVLIAAQALGLGLPASDFVVATTNVGHLNRFVPAQEWETITP